MLSAAMHLAPPSAARHLSAAALSAAALAAAPALAAAGAEDAGAGSWLAIASADDGGGAAVRALLGAALTWVALRGVRLVARVAEERLAAGDPLASRGAKTQIMVLRRVGGVVTLLVGAAMVLLQFRQMRALGTSLLASAGVAGVIIGLAAQRSIASLAAGLQLSITQPVRVGDYVTIEGESGVVEEITLTYVVIRVWDHRRLVLPITRFLETSFQNWTRTGAAVTGPVRVQADARVPVPELRREVEAFVRARPEWDGRSLAVQVTALSARGVELRVVVSAPDPDRLQDLRFAVREHVLAVLQRLDGGAYLPRLRTDAGEPARPARSPDEGGRARRGGVSVTPVPALRG
jgi:small-conductance mechanosensitive channel